MSNVTKAGAATGPSPGAGHRDVDERPPKGGEFEAVLREKGEGARRERTEAGHEGTRAGGVEDRSARRASGSGEPGADRGRAEPGAWRALPGDVAVPARPAPGTSAPLGGSRAADAVARVERIAEQVLRAVEVRLGAGGTAEARLELDLGGLGQLRVALHRDAEGTLAVRFDAAGPEASRLLVDHGGDLVARLEARGLALREVVLARSDGSVVRLHSPAEPAPADLASRSPHDGSRTRDEAPGRQPEDERRGRRAAEPVEDEE
jgi:hypothetical protein